MGEACPGMKGGRRGADHSLRRLARLRLAAIRRTLPRLLTLPGCCTTIVYCVSHPQTSDMATLNI